MDGNANHLVIYDLKSHIQTESLLRELRERMEEDSSIQLEHPLDEHFLLKFLRSRSFDVKKALHSIKLYLNAWNTHPEIFTDPNTLQIAFDSNAIGILPDKHPVTGESILITRPGAWDPSEYSFEKYSAATAVTLEVAAMDEETQVKGIIDIIDMSGFGWKQFKAFGLTQAKKTAEITEKILPIRFNEIHIVNESYAARMAHSLLKSFLSDEFNKKIHFHGSDYSKLHTRVPSNILPIELGGSRGHFSSRKWYNYICQNNKNLMDYWTQSRTVISSRQ